MYNQRIHVCILLLFLRFVCAFVSRLVDGEGSMVRGGGGAEWQSIWGVAYSVSRESFASSFLLCMPITTGELSSARFPFNFISITRVWSSGVAAHYTHTFILAIPPPLYTLLYTPHRVSMPETEPRTAIWLIIFTVS